MANDLAILSSNLPAHLAGANFGVTQNLMEGMYTGGNRIGLKGSRFRLVVAGIEEGVIEENYLDVIILGAAPAVSRVYYAENYKQGENQPPTCYSADGVHPAEDVKAKQGDKCMTCPMNAKGSKVVDNQSFKACGYFRRVVVMLAGDVEDRRIFKLDVKSQGLFGDNTANEKNLNDYIKMVATRGVDLGAVVTRVSFDINSSVPKLLFKPNRYISEEEMYAVQDLVVSDEVINLKTVTMSTLDVSGEQPTSGDEDLTEAQAPAPAPAAPQRPATQRPAPQQTAKPVQQAPRQAQQPVRTPTQTPAAAPAPAAQKPVQQATRPAPQRPAAAQTRTPAPAPAPVAAEASTDDELAALLDGLEG